jgi:hypothetical protein
MAEVILYFFILRTPNTSSRIPGGKRTPGWIPLYYTITFLLFIIN